MSTAKQIIVDNLSVISDDIQDEFEVLDGLYKLLKLEKSRELALAEGTISSEEVREHFVKKHESAGTLA